MNKSIIYHVTKARPTVIRTPNKRRQAVTMPTYTKKDS